MLRVKEESYNLRGVSQVLASHEVEDDGIPFEEKMTEFTAQLYKQFTKAGQLEAVIEKNLEVLGYGE